MNQSTPRAGWIKWVVGSSIALIGAGGGLVAFMQYLDARRDAKIRQYEADLAEWNSFSPQSTTFGAQELEIKGGECVDLNLGRPADSISSDADLCFFFWPDERKWGLAVFNGVAWADLGVVDFASVDYRTVRDAPFKGPNSTRGEIDFLYKTDKDDVPGPRYTYALRLNGEQVAKVQIKAYREERRFDRDWPYVRIVYEVFPILPDPPRPRSP